jgi:predicted flap endonuclease-1-like 5' DNA nuclease
LPSFLRKTVMAVTRLERKARRNKTKAKERIASIKRNIRKVTIASPYKEESGIVMEEDIEAVIGMVDMAPKAKAAPKKKSEPKAEKVEEVKEDKPTASAAKAAPKKKATKADKGDDLTKIEGVGPKIAATIAAGGLDTYAKVAASTPEAIREILDNAEGNFKAHDPGTWPKQAELAAEGKWDELKAWQDELDGGK